MTDSSKIAVVGTIGIAVVCVLSAPDGLSAFNVMWTGVGCAALLWVIAMVHELG